MNLARTFLPTLIFAVSGFIASAQTLQTLCSFSGTNGAFPAASLILGNDGNFYGTTIGGSPYWYGNGTIFRVTTNGTLTNLVTFTILNNNYTRASMTLGNDGNFYGTTELGGNNNLNSNLGGGTIFQMTTNGSLTDLVSFNGTNGAEPWAGLTLGNDGNFYGTTFFGGSYTNLDDSYSGGGTIFRVTTNGTLTMLVSFNGTNGANPLDALTLGSDGNFYGTTEVGSSNGDTLFNNGDGTVFKVTTNGTLTTLVYFNGTNGAEPWAGLALGNDGNFYGTTAYGGSNNLGTVFQVTTNGTLTTLVSFNGTNGAEPVAALTLGNDGNFYGTTEAGGCYTNLNNGYGGGTIFRVTTNGVLTTLISFNGTNGLLPEAALTLGNDGNFYGTTIAGGDYGGGNGDGTIFRLSVPPTQPMLTLQFWSSYPLLTLYGTLGDTYTIQCTTNLADPNWTPMLIVPNLSISPSQMIDPAGIELSAKFYRALQQ